MPFSDWRKASAGKVHSMRGNRCRGFADRSPSCRQPVLYIHWTSSFFQPPTDSWGKGHRSLLNPVSSTRVDGWPVSITRQHGPCWRARVSTSRVDGSSTRLVETRTRQHGPCWWVMETGHPSTQVVETGL